MYSPYDNYIEQTQQALNTDNVWQGKENYFAPGKILAGTMAMGAGGTALGTGALMAGYAHRSGMRNSPGYASAMNKFVSSEIYKSVTSPKTAFEPFMPIGFREVNKFDKLNLRSALNGGHAGFPMPKWAPGYGRIFDANAARSMGTARGLSSAAIYPRFAVKLPVILPLSMGMGIMSEQAVNNHPSAVAAGVARTGLSFAGAGVGQVIGGAIGSFAGPVGTFAGSIIGGAVGGMVGDSVMDVAKWIKHKGREWSRANLGGTFHDSQQAMTMRQRSLNAIYTSQFNVRSNLGGEAYRLATGY